MRWVLRRKADSLGFGRWVLLREKVEDGGGSGGAGVGSGGGGGVVVGSFACLFELLFVFDFDLDLAGFSSEHFSLGLGLGFWNWKVKLGLILPFRCIYILDRVYSKCHVSCSIRSSSVSDSHLKFMILLILVQSSLE